VEAKVAADPQLQRLAENHRALHAQLKDAFDPVAQAPVPERLEAALHPSAEVIDFGAAKRARTPRALPQWAALAATLAVGIFAGTMIPHRGGVAPVEVQGGQIYAAASLDRALNTQLASAPAGDVRVGITFRAHAGEICRTFTQSAASGLACRVGGRWKLKGLFGAAEGQGSDYRMAAGMDPNLAALVDSTMAGEPFDAAKENAAKERGWK
jgi:hypothetical protein